MSDSEDLGSSSLFKEEEEKEQEQEEEEEEEQEEKQYYQKMVKEILCETESEFPEITLSPNYIIGFIWAVVGKINDKLSTVPTEYQHLELSNGLQQMINEVIDFINKKLPEEYRKIVDMLKNIIQGLFCQEACLKTPRETNTEDINKAMLYHAHRILYCMLFIEFYTNRIETNRLAKSLQKGPKQFRTDCFGFFTKNRSSAAMQIVHKCVSFPIILEYEYKNLPRRWNLLTFMKVLVEKSLQSKMAALQDFLYDILIQHGYTEDEVKGCKFQPKSQLQHSFTEWLRYVELDAIESVFNKVVNPLLKDDIVADDYQDVDLIDTLAFTQLLENEYIHKGNTINKQSVYESNPGDLEPANGILKPSDSSAFYKLLANKENYKEMFRTLMAVEKGLRLKSEEINQNVLTHLLR